MQEREDLWPPVLHRGGEAFQLGHAGLPGHWGQTPGTGAPPFTQLVGVLLGGSHDDFLPRFTRSNLVWKSPANRGRLTKRGPRPPGSCGRSFTADTLVLLADGTVKPIGQIEAGDQVLATDPETGRQSAETVLAVWVASSRDPPTRRPTPFYRPHHPPHRRRHRLDHHPHVLCDRRRHACART